VFGGSEASMDELLRDFLTETAEGLDRVDSQLVRLEQEPDNGQVLGSIFQSFGRVSQRFQSRQTKKAAGAFDRAHKRARACTANSRFSAAYPSSS
jgi:chemotaxis protein histidine kinase CheA